MKIEKRRRILKIVLSRPDIGNSLDPHTILKLRKEFLDAQTNDEINVIQLMGEGEKDFCTGMDINAARDLSPQNKSNIANLAGDIATLIYHGKPTIVALNGRAMGMGVVFSVAADYRIAKKGIKLRMPEVNFSIFPGASCIVQMNRVCGQSWTRRILMRGNYFTPETAKKANIIDEIAEPDDFERKTKKIVRDFRKKNPVLLKAIKKAIVGTEELSYGEGVQLEDKFSQYYLWDNPEEVFEESFQKFSLNFPLLGKPELLEKELQS